MLLFGSTTEGALLRDKYDVSLTNPAFEILFCKLDYVHGGFTLRRAAKGGRAKMSRIGVIVVSVIAVLVDSSPQTPSQKCCSPVNQTMLLRGRVASTLIKRLCCARTDV